MSEVKVERRCSTRYPVNLVVEVEGRKGVTRNISAWGVYIEMRQRPVSGEPIHFTLVFEFATPTPMQLTCVGSVVRVEYAIPTPMRLTRVGSVVRVEPHAEGYGIAIAITSHGIKSSSP
jgi:hypothetical protein